MPEITEVLPDFDMMSVRYDPAKKPYFRVQLVEELRRIQSCAAGKTLLQLIKDAKPKSRADFPVDTNVMCVPQEVTFVQSGFKREYIPNSGGKQTLNPSIDPRHSPEGCPFYRLGGSKNAAKDPVASTNGQGSVCTMYFTNAELLTSKGEKAYPFIVLAHELIHSYHCLYGIKKDGKDEELWTTGIGVFADEKLTENVFRTQLKVAGGLRTQYF